MKFKRSSKHKRIDHLTHPWPDDLPKKCPNCTHPFHTQSNIIYGKFGIGETLETALWWSPMVFFPILGILMVTIDDARAAFVASLFYTTVISIAIKVIHSCLPFERKLTCLKCDYSRIDKAHRYKR